MTSISEHFANIGDYFAADTETALAPECFKGRDHVRLFQAYNPDYSFYIDLAQLDNDDWCELKVNLENPGLHTSTQSPDKIQSSIQRRESKNPTMKTQRCLPTK